MTNVEEIITSRQAGRIDRYLSGCICDQCGTSRYDIDIWNANYGTTDAECCDITEVFDAEKGYKL